MAQDRRKDSYGGRAPTNYRACRRGYNFSANTRTLDIDNIDISFHGISSNLKCVSHAMRLLTYVHSCSLRIDADITDLSEIRSAFSRKLLLSLMNTFNYNEFDYNESHLMIKCNLILRLILNA